MKQADKFLSSPKPKEMVTNNKNSDGEKTVSVSSLVSGLNLNLATGIPGIPAVISQTPDTCNQSVPGSDPMSAKITPAKTDTVTETGPDPAQRGGGDTGFSNGDGKRGTLPGAGCGGAAGTGGGISDRPKKCFRDMGSGSESPRRAGSGFPSDYLNVRKFREKANPYVELPTPFSNRCKEAVCVCTAPGFDLQGDSRQHNVNNYLRLKSEQTSFRPHCQRGTCVAERGSGPCCTTAVSKYVAHVST
jgi:hypothetical protein